jgi:MFS family permease
MHKALKILIISSIFYNFAAGLFGPIYAIFVQRIGGTIITAGLAWTIYTFFVGVLLLIFGSLGDRFNKRKLFVIGRVVNTIGITGYLFVTSPLQLFVVQGILGIATSLMNPTFEAIFSRNLQKGKETRDWSLWEGSINIVLAVAAFLGASIAEIYGFRVLFLFMAIASAISTLVATLLLKKKIWLHFIRI